MFISESKFLTFNLYNLFSLGFLILCILFLPISAFFLATLSLPRVPSPVFVLGSQLSGRTCGETLATQATISPLPA